MDYCNKLFMQKNKIKILSILVYGPQEPNCCFILFIFSIVFTDLFFLFQFSKFVYKNTGGECICFNIFALLFLYFIVKLFSFHLNFLFVFFCFHCDFFATKFYCRYYNSSKDTSSLTGRQSSGWLLVVVGFYYLQQFSIEQKQKK